MTKKLLSFVMAFCMCAIMFCGAICVSAAEADTVSVTNMTELASAISNARHNNGPKTIYLADGTYTVTANDQLFLYGCDGIALIGQSGNASNVIIDCGSYTSSGMAGMVVMTNGATLANLTLKNASSESNIPVLKIACYDGGTAASVIEYENVSVNNVVIENNAFSSALIIQGVNNVSLNGISVNNTVATKGWWIFAENNSHYPIAIASSNDVSIANASIHSAYEKAAPIGFNYAAENYLYADVSSLNIVDASSITCTYGSDTTNQGIVVVSERPTSAGLDMVKVDGVQVVKTTDTAQDGSSNVTGWYAYDATDWADYDAGYLYTNSSKTPSDIEAE